MTAASWTPEEDAQIVRLYDQRYPISKIAILVGRTIPATRNRICAIRDGRVRARADMVKDPAQMKRRACLCCGRDFTSQHVGNRVCSPCKDTETWRGGGSAMDADPMPLRGTRAV